MRDELTFSASDTEDAPESPILFMFIQNEKSFNEIVENNHTPKFNSVRDEFTSRADDNEDAPDEPILFIRNGKCTNEKQMKSFKSELILKSNEVRDELTFSADDNEDAPVSPISLQIECEKNSNV